MGKDLSQKSPAREQDSGQSSSAELAARIERLEQMLIHTRKKRICQSYVVWICTVILVAVCAWFLISFSNLITEYNTQKLILELQKNSDIVMKSPQFQGILMDAKDVFIPAYQKALQAKLDTACPKLRSEAEAEMSKLKELLIKKIQDNFIAQMHKDFEKVEKDLLKRYPDLDSSQLDSAYKEASELFTERMTNSLNVFVGKAIDKLTGLDETFRQFKNQGLYAKLQNKPVQEVESLLLESMLELWIYELNPAKGARPVEAGTPQ
ncbi:MAG: hypothetical protein PHV59_01155 [Victivallales bacterium]|nr:hypothetical protein [Victivallales bacterium]